MASAQEPPLEALSQRFMRFAQRECQASPLYERLALGLAHDPAVLTLTAQARPGQPGPNLFLAAVHLLLLQGHQHPLAAFYPSLSASTSASGDPYPVFRAFCAVRIARQEPPRLIAGDALDGLPEVVTAIPDGHTLCVFHTHTVNQFPPPARARLSALLAEQATRRDLYRLSIEWLGTEHPQLELIAFEHGEQTAQLLAHCGSHGEWLAIPGVQL